jgi:hypothetical protein
MSDNSPKISIVLRVNGEENAEVFDDEPLILSISIINDAAIRTAFENFPLKERMKNLEKMFKAKMLDEDEFKRVSNEIRSSMKKAAIYRFGCPIGWSEFVKIQVMSEGQWVQVDWPIRLLGYFPPEPVAELDELTTCYVEFGIDAEDPKRPRGAHEMRAVTEIIKGEIIESNISKVNFIGKKIPKDRRDSDETLMAKAEYLYKRGRYDESRNVIGKVLETNPNLINALTLLGDIEEKKGGFTAALSAYMNAAEEFEKQYSYLNEPPEILVSNIIRLQALVNR